MTELRKRNPSSNNDTNSSNEDSENTIIDDDIKYKDNIDHNANYFKKLLQWLWLEEDASYLGIFRIFWGIIMSYEIWIYVRNNYNLTKSSFYTTKFGFHSKYFPFGWVELVPFDLMTIILIVTLISAIFITIGFRYRMCCFTFFLGVSYLFLLDSIHYLNHMYLVCVMSFIMIFIPCNIVYSVDSLRNNNSTPTVPKIYLFFIRTFIYIVYTYAGIVKINEDWLRAEPLRHWVGKKTELGGLLQLEITAYVMSYGGMLYDLSVGLLLLWNPTFWIGIAGTIFFHSMNKLIFNIGIFPYVMITSTSLFFRPDWPRKLYSKLKRDKSYKPVADTDVLLKNFKPKKDKTLSNKQKIFTGLIILFIIIWALFPLRCYFYSGQTVWTENSHVFSWRMKLRDRDCTVNYFGINRATNETFYIPFEKIVSPKQTRKLPNRPCILIQFAHFLADLYNDGGMENPEIYTYADCSVNYRPMEKYTNRTIDMGRAPKWETPTWILPLSPLTEKHKSQYPWNWTFNEKLWKKLWKNNAKSVSKIHRGRKERDDNLKISHTEEFKEYVSDRFFNGNISKVEILEKVPPSYKRAPEYFPKRKI